MITRKMFLGIATFIISVAISSEFAAAQQKPYGSGAGSTVTIETGDFVPQACIDLSPTSAPHLVVFGADLGRACDWRFELYDTWGMPVSVETGSDAAYYCLGYRHGDGFVAYLGHECSIDGFYQWVSVIFGIEW